MTFENLRHELDELTKIQNPAERLLGILRFMSLCSGLQAAGMLTVARESGAEAEQLVTEMNELANACLPLAVLALNEVVNRVGYGTTAS
jgi:hypothetical protein